MTQIFTALLLTSATGTALALVLTLLKPITRKFFSGGWHYYMWLVVLLVMVFPVKLNLPEKPETTLPVSETVTITDNQEEHTETPVITETQPEQVIKELPEKASTAQVIKDFLSGKVILLSLIWLMGAVLLFLIKIVSYLVFLIKIHKYSEFVSCPETKAYTNRKIKTRVISKIRSPLLIGIIRPTLLLPKTEITPEQLHNVLAHEMTHLKRNDILYKWFISVVKCVHWFNPAIYFISKQFSIDCEISCDLAVVKEMDNQQEKKYIETILSLLAHNNSKSIPLTTGMTGNKETLKKRFTMIKNKIKVSRKATIISAILAVLILIMTVFASSILNGTLFKGYDNPIMKLNTSKVESNEFVFLFVGLDNNNRADAIMLLAVQEDTFKGLSIPRNTVFGDKSISDILATENGDQELIDTIKATVAVPIHYYAKMNLSAVKEIVDNVGGIDFEVPMDMVYDDPYQDLHINLKKGVQTLNGEEVCQLLQFRSAYPEDDLSRIQLHQQFLKEFIKQKLNKDNIDKAPEIFKVISNNIKTNYPISNLKQDMKIISAINSNNITFETISGRVTIHNDMSVYELDLDNQISNDNRKIKTMGLSFEFTPNSTWIQNIKLTEVNANHSEIDYYDSVLGSNCKMIISKEKPISFTQYGFSNSLDQTWHATEKSVTIRVQQAIKEKVAVATWNYESFNFAIIGEEVSADNSAVSSIPKTAIFIINNMKIDTYNNSTESNLPVSSKVAYTSELKNEITPKNDIKIKATTSSDNSDIVLSHLTLKPDIDFTTIEQSLKQSGITISKDSRIDLSKNYILGICQSGDNIETYCDNNGNITLYFNANENDYIDIIFTDNQTGKVVAEYGVMPDMSKSYSFMGFEKGKEYDIQLQEHIKNDINYIVY